ncbi:MAG TPA: hypothetical protein VFG04_19450 [Planctomycetaceae bacterium]|nr:hypothetical protein [Planctomycetaceae bacterium]
MAMVSKGATIDGDQTIVGLQTGLGTGTVRIHVRDFQTLTPGGLRFKLKSEPPRLSGPAVLWAALLCLTSLLGSIRSLLDPGLWVGRILSRWLILRHDLSADSHHESRDRAIRQPAS